VSGYPVELCRLTEIPDGGAKGLDLGAAYDPREIFLVREGQSVYGYVNSCPHLGTPLEMIDDQFLNEDGFILCTTHGALFEPDDGECIAGPCMGDYLTPLSLEVEKDGLVLLLERPDHREV